MKLVALSLLLAFCGLAQAEALSVAAPACLNHGQTLTMNDDQVAQWKHTSANEYHDRGHVNGTVTSLYADETGHRHFQLTMNSSTPETIEIVYDLKFGALPPLKAGDMIEACGDYITSNAPYQGYPISPDGALIHWVHRTDTASHDAGFLTINGQVFGQN